MPETPQAYAFERFTLDLRRGCLRQDDRELPLRPKSLAVLRHLIENAGRLISKDELIDAAWPNGIATDASLARCISDIRFALEDDDQRIIKTMFRRGYVFAASVARRPDDGSARQVTGAPAIQAPRLSVVVLPFANLGGEEQSYLIQGIAEDLTTDLSRRIRDAFVISSRTALTYRDRLLDVRLIGRELGVRYVLEGSVQAGTTRIRVNAQLIDAESGAHLWADRFDKPRLDIFELQDQITAMLARTIGVELLEAAGRRAERERPNNMDSFDLTLRGRAMLHGSRSMVRFLDARRLFEEALRLDDQNAVALSCLALTHAYEVVNLLADDPAGQTRIAEAAILKSLALAPDSAYAHITHSVVLCAQRAPRRALEEAEIAIDLDRNLAVAYAHAGLMKIYLGRAEETNSAVTDAMRRSPRDPLIAHWLCWDGFADLCLNRNNRAIGCLRRATSVNSSLGAAWYLLASALALEGFEAEAKEACEVARKLVPGLTLAKLRGYQVGDNPIYLTQRARMLEGARRAGIPE